MAMTRSMYLRQYYGLKRQRERELDVSIKARFAEVRGTSFKVTEEVCHHPDEMEVRPHKKIAICEDGETGEPLCPIVVALRRNWELIRSGRESKPGLVNQLLKEAAYAIPD